MRKLLLALTLTAMTPLAFAQDESASGKHVSIVGGYSMTETTKNPWIQGNGFKADGEGTPTLGVTYLINDNIGIEAWGADRIGQRTSTKGGAKVGSFDSQPYSLSGQYHFGDVDNTVRPFLGLGYHETNYSNESFGENRVGIETAKGGVATVGMDVNFNPTWFMRADARYFHNSGSDVKVNGVKVGEVDMNPVMLGVGVGARF